MSSNQKMNNLKKNLSLNLEQAKNGIGLQITSPDINMCNVNTPELERIILSNNISTNTPIITPSTTNILFPKTVTKEQENFATGFMDVLNNLHNNNSQASDSGSGIGGLASDNDHQQQLTNCTGTFHPTYIKEEPQTVPNIPNSPPLSPVNMEHQERIKLERKRQRNRLAASKCRSRKLERISKLEDRVKQLKSENVELGSVLNQLKEHVGTLKLEVMEHVNAGCNIIMQ